MVDSSAGLDIEGFGDGRLSVRLRDREFHGFAIERVDFPELVLAGVEREIIFEAETALKVCLDGLAFIEGAGMGWWFCFGVFEVEGAVEMGAERNIFQRGWSALVPDTSERKHFCIERAIEHSSFLMIGPIDSDAEGALEVIHGDEFT